jgi:hypothetical protein
MKSIDWHYGERIADEWEDLEILPVRREGNDFDEC